MKKFLAVLFLLPSLAFAQPKPDVWDLAAYGSLPDVEYVRLDGWNPGITTTFEAIWGESAAYTPLLVALSSPYCASTSANDDLAGTGARTIRVKGVDTSFAAFSEDLETDGQTSVSLTTANVLFISSIEVLTAGSGVLNAGVIACGTGANTGGDPAVVHQYLGASSATAVPASGAGYLNISQSLMYAVPDNHKMICRNIQCGSVFATAAAGHECVLDGYTNSTGVGKRYYVQMQHNTGSNPSQYPSTVVFPEKTLVIGKMAGVTGTDVGPASMSMECLLISTDSDQVIF